MKLKFDKIENENFILKSLRFQKEKTFHFGTVMINTKIYYRLKYILHLC